MLEPEWISWSPDSPGYPNAPVPPGTDCEVRMRDKAILRDKGLDTFPQWNHGRAGRLRRYDIIAYRVWPAAEEARAAEQVQLAEATAGHFIEDDARALLVEIATVWRERQSANLLARIDDYLERSR